MHRNFNDDVITFTGGIAMCNYCNASHSPEQCTMLLSLLEYLR